jgi:opacity protein-like surface antigen
MMKKTKLMLFIVFLGGFSLPAVSQETAMGEEPKVHIFVSGLYNAQTFTISDTRSTPMFLEESSFRGNWTTETGPAFGFGGSYQIFSGLAVGAAIEILSSTPTETFQASLPHPLYFDSDRTVDGGPVSLSYKENVAHFLVSYTRIAGRFVVAVSGGPSYFMTKTEVIDEFTYTDSYPFDEATLGSIQPRTFDANGLGFNVGGWVGFRIAGPIAVGADLRYSQGKPKFTTSAGNEVEVSAGGARVGAGVRFLF